MKIVLVTSTGNEPTKVINGGLEHLRSSALAFRSLAIYIARSLRETGGADHDYTLDCDEPSISSSRVSVVRVHTWHEGGPW
jgi:hypothetical protein